MAYSHPYCIILGVKVKHKKVYFRIFWPSGCDPGRLFVFGETKRPAEADLFVVPHLAMRLNSSVKKVHDTRCTRFFGENQDVQGAAEPYLFDGIIIDACGGSVKRKNNKFRR